MSEPGRSIDPRLLAAAIEEMIHDMVQWLLSENVIQERKGKRNVRIYQKDSTIVYDGDHFAVLYGPGQYEECGHCRRNRIPAAGDSRK